MSTGEVGKGDLGRFSRRRLEGVFLMPDGLYNRHIN